MPPFFKQLVLCWSCVHKLRGQVGKCYTRGLFLAAIVFGSFSHGKGFGANSCFGVLWANRFHLRKGSVEGSPTLLYTSLHLSPMCIPCASFEVFSLVKGLRTNWHVCLLGLFGANGWCFWEGSLEGFPQTVFLYVCFPVSCCSLDQRAVASEKVLGICFLHLSPSLLWLSGAKGCCCRGGS